MNYLVVDDKQSMGRLNAFSAGTLDEMLSLANVYLIMIDHYEAQDLSTVMIQYN